MIGGKYLEDVERVVSILLWLELDVGNLVWNILVWHEWVG